AAYARRIGEDLRAVRAPGAGRDGAEGVGPASRWTLCLAVRIRHDLLRAGRRGDGLRVALEGMRRPMLRVAGAQGRSQTRVFTRRRPLSRRSPAPRTGIERNAS